MQTVYQAISHPHAAGLTTKGGQMKAARSKTATGSVLQYTPGVNPECCCHIFVFTSLTASMSLWTTRTVIQEVLTVRKSSDLKLTVVHATALLCTIVTCLLGWIVLAWASEPILQLIKFSLSWKSRFIFILEEERQRQKQRRRQKRQLFYNKGKKHQTTSCLYILTLPISKIQEIRFFFFF